MHSFIDLTVHTFVKLQSKSMLLHFVSFTGSHTGSNFAADIDNVIANRKLRGKIIYIISDNASNMKKAGDILRQSYSEERDET
jgi:hypothetical protein